MKKRRIISALLSLVLLCSAALMSGCKLPFMDKEADTTAASETTEKVIDSTDAVESEELSETEEPLPLYHEITSDGNLYGYILYANDETVAREDSGFVEEPQVIPIETVDGLVLKVTADKVTYYYNYDTGEFSETHCDVFDEHDKLIVKGDGDRIIICGIFGNEYYKEITEFTYSLYTKNGSPFVRCFFTDGAAAINVAYLAWDPNQYAVFERSECVNLTNDNRYIIVHDWANALEDITVEEAESVLYFLSWRMGTYDYNTGYNLTYAVTGSIIVNGIRYLHCECYYVMDDGESETLVKAAEFVLSERQDAKFDCRETDGDMEIYIGKNLI